MRIGVNALYLVPGDVGGTEIYLRFLLSSFAEISSADIDSDEYFVFVNRETGADLVPAAPRFHLVRCGVRARYRPLRIIYEQVVLPFLLSRHCVDVVLNPGFTAPVAARCPSVTVFHDLQHKTFPQFFRRRELPFWNLLLWLAAEVSSSLIAVSEATARDIGAYLPRHATKTCVVPHGVDPEFYRIGERRARSSRPSDPYVLAVSTLHPHKNLERLLEAFRELVKSGSNHRLVIVGLKGLAAKRLENRARELLPSERVCFTGWIPRDRLYQFFENADAFISPSLFEGFGLPVVEALAAGIPAACSAIPVYYVTGGGAAVRFDPHSVSRMAAALRRVTTDSDFRAQAALAGPGQAGAFEWSRSAAMTLRELRKAARGSA
jgi:glycosyltransferase involved in cell wall biosynthesis